MMLHTPLKLLLDKRFKIKRNILGMHFCMWLDSVEGTDLLLKHPLRVHVPIPCARRSCSKCVVFVDHGTLSKMCFPPQHCSSG